MFVATFFGENHPSVVVFFSLPGSFLEWSVEVNFFFEDRNAGNTKGLRNVPFICWL